jgi:hypothetical protein
MNYLKVYCNLIRKAENRTPPESYTEKHHTFPKSIFGKNTRLVVLTAREHYVAHALLEKVYIKRYGLKDKRTIKMICAHTYMKGNGGYINSYLYECAKIRRNALIRGENHPNYGKPRTDEIKKQISDKLSGKNNPNYGKKWTEEQRKKVNEKIKGENHWFYGKSLTEEHKEKIGVKVRGKNNPRYGKPGCVGEKNGMYGSERFGELNPMYGKEQSEETKKLISQKAKERYENGFVSPTLGRKMSEKQVLSMSKEFCVVSPDGETIKAINQSEFCRKNNLGQAAFNRMLNGKYKHYKGWTLPKLAQELPKVPENAL